VAHILSCQSKLQSPSILRLFHISLIDTRCLRASLSTREYIGLSRDIQSEWEKDFTFVIIGDPQFGLNNYKKDLSIDLKIQTGGLEFEIEQNRLLQTIISINRCRPKFVIICGDITNAYPTQSSYTSQTEAFRRCISRISETIPVLFLPGNHDLGDEITKENLELYHKSYGADYYGFWYGGMRGLVINTSLMIHADKLPDEAKLQNEWLENEIEQAILCATSVLIFQHHPWFIDNIGIVYILYIIICI
jgi:3',5'-cyclic AMP phosphodiesterase CpdA